MEIIFKPTHACNGNCVYCSAGEFRDEPAVFPIERLAPTFDTLRAWMIQDDDRRLRFIWHGGEPLLCGIGFYRRVIEDQHRVFAKDMWRVQNAVQSNITLVNEEWIPVIKELMQDQSLGTSFDLAEGIRGLKNGDDVNDKWLRAFLLLRERGIRVGVVYTVHKRSIANARNIYYFFRNLDPALSVRFNAMYRQGCAKNERAASLHITADEFGRFLVDLFEVWKADSMRMNVSPLIEWQRAWFGDLNALCCDGRGVCHETHLGLNPDGTVYGCGRASDDCSHPLGNIFTDAFEEILTREPRASLGRRSETLQETCCRDCPYWHLCRGGCPMVAWLYHGDLFRESYFCESKKMVFGRYREEFGPPASPQAAVPA